MFLLFLNTAMSVSHAVPLTKKYQKKTNEKMKKTKKKQKCKKSKNMKKIKNNENIFLKKHKNEKKWKNEKKKGAASLLSAIAGVTVPLTNLPPVLPHTF